MKKKLGILALTIVLISCSTPVDNSTTVRDIHTCNFPTELTEQIGYEHDFYWDCEWQACHNDGDVTLRYNSDSSKVIGVMKHSSY
jgi:hypothetical protein